jgi:hypothetical protein
MLKSKTKPKVVKPKIKKTVSIAKYPKQHQDKHVRNFPQTTGTIQTSLPPRPLYSSGGGIPYLSSLESYGITNKPPYYLQSLMAKTSQNDYTQPAQAQTSSVLTGANPMSGGAKITEKTFPPQAQTQSIQYVDLVAPAKSGNSETQPDYIALEPDITGNIQTRPANKMKNELIERAEYRKKNNIAADKKVSEIMAMEQHGFIKPTPSSKRLRGEKAPKYNELRKK